MSGEDVPRPAGGDGEERPSPFPQPHHDGDGVDQTPQRSRSTEKTWPRTCQTSGAFVANAVVVLGNNPLQATKPQPSAQPYVNVLIFRNGLRTCLSSPVLRFSTAVVLHDVFAASKLEKPPATLIGGILFTPTDRNLCSSSDLLAIPHYHIALITTTVINPTPARSLLI
ncbi:hypothetical protein WN55_09449 [Dufourea novaeangliae]|uniref:Uncharacterized protein n=1 Tax=Dufourea novaeangliae TaxID=178035 RepID=A0A154PT50_DUFNO|nr:hypothetical protein WN55_09449 [Dufourea novaeangliae]